MIFRHPSPFGVIVKAWWEERQAFGFNLGFASGNPLWLPLEKLAQVR